MKKFSLLLALATICCSVQILILLVGNLPLLNTLKYGLSTIFEDGTSCKNFYANGSLQNFAFRDPSGQRGFESVDQLITNYPWYSQLYFDSPGEPYCWIDVLYKPNFQSLDLSKISSDLEGEPFYLANIRNYYQDALSKGYKNIEALYNDRGFILIYKEAGLYKVYGYFGYYSVP